MKEELLKGESVTTVSLQFPKLTQEVAKLKSAPRKWTVVLRLARPKDLAARFTLTQ